LAERGSEVSKLEPEESLWPGVATPLSKYASRIQNARSWVL